MSKTRKITVPISPEMAEYLHQLAQSSAIQSGKIEDVVSHLVYSAVDGVRRPGSWEHGWVAQAFGDFPEGQVDPNAPYKRLPVAAASAK